MSLINREPSPAQSAASGTFIKRATRERSRIENRHFTHRRCVYTELYDLQICQKLVI